MFGQFCGGNMDESRATISRTVSTNRIPSRDSDDIRRKVSSDFKVTTKLNWPKTTTLTPKRSTGRTASKVASRVDSKSRLDVSRRISAQSRKAIFTSTVPPVATVVPTRANPKQVPTNKQTKPTISVVKKSENQSSYLRPVTSAINYDAKLENKVLPSFHLNARNQVMNDDRPLCDEQWRQIEMKAMARLNLPSCPTTDAGTLNFEDRQLADAYQKALKEEMYEYFVEQKQSSSLLLLVSLWIFVITVAIVWLLYAYLTGLFLPPNFSLFTKTTSELTDYQFNKEVLDRHNYYRAKVGVQPLQLEQWVRIFSHTIPLSPNHSNLANHNGQRYSHRAGETDSRSVGRCRSEPLSQENLSPKIHRQRNRSVRCILYGQDLLFLRSSRVYGGFARFDRQVFEVHPDGVETYRGNWLCLQFYRIQCYGNVEPLFLYRHLCLPSGRKSKGTVWPECSHISAIIN